MSKNHFNCNIQACRFTTDRRKKMPLNAYAEGLEME